MKKVTILDLKSSNERRIQKMKKENSILCENVNEKISMMLIGSLPILIFISIFFSWYNVGDKTYDDYISYNTGTIVSVRGIFDTKYIIKLDESDDRVYASSLKPYLIGDKVVVKENNNKYYFSTEDEMTEFYKNKSKKVIVKSPTTYVEKSLNDAMKMITEIQEEEKNNISIN